MTIQLPPPICAVIIPSYNYASRVVRAIKSVMEQTITNIRGIIVDDGSTDNTEEVVKDAIKNDRRFAYIHQTNGGVATARNSGVFSDFAENSPYVCCLDADDAIAPQFLEACIDYLEKNPAISIAYTGLWYLKPDGSQGLSTWPGEFSYDKQLEGRNQIPTCNVSRRVMWDRLGGQRQRYAPEGAGEEDAEMWLRAGAYGFRAKKVTDAGLFLYSWQSGRVSGNKAHAMVDYRSWHPWTRDGMHPLLSLATPKDFSHPARQYDEPIISVVIPVGPNHEQDVINALDSLDAQTFRRWEAVVVWDTSASPSYIMRTFPHIILVRPKNAGGQGAGYARNRGVEIARAPLILFLDADDWLHPEALAKMYTAHTKTGKIIYTDYVGRAIIDEKLANDLRAAGRLMEYDQKSRLALISHKSSDFDCSRAQRQPDPGNMYIWNLVTALMPRQYHFEIGGFDETMKSWEDWDYNIRLARAGKCFFRLEEQLVCYRFYTGNRRETGVKEHNNLVKYLQEKYSKGEVMGCGCSGGNAPMLESRSPEMLKQEEGRSLAAMSDENFVLCIYTHPNLGEHRVIGPATGIDYGWRGGGAEFLVDRRDIAVMPMWFREKYSIPQAPIQANQPVSISAGEPAPKHTTVLEADPLDLEPPPPPLSRPKVDPLAEQSQTLTQPKKVRKPRALRTKS